VIAAHSSEEYAREGVHIYGIEGFWSYAKAWLYHFCGVPNHPFIHILKK
jgi:hypothetical protein